MLTFFFAVARFAGFLVRSIPSSSSVSSLSSSVYCFRAASRVGFLMNKDCTIHMEKDNRYFLLRRHDSCSPKHYLASSNFFCSSILRSSSASFFVASISNRFFVSGFPSRNSRHLASINLDMYPETILGFACGY